MWRIFSSFGRDRIVRLVRFAIVGAAGTAFYYLILSVLVEFLGVSVMYATSIAFLLVTGQTYISHYIWTFESGRPHIATLPRFFAMNVVGFCVNWGVMFVGVQCAEFNYLAVQALALTIVITWNLTLTHFWIFGHYRR